MQNASLGESQVGIKIAKTKKKIAERNIYNLRTSDIQKINGRN